MKSKSRKFLSLFLAVVMVISVIPFGVITATAETSGDFDYSVLYEGEKTCEITKYNGTATELTIPSQLDGYTVISIGYRAFRGCSSLTSVTISNSVISIGDDAFRGCTSLESVTIPDSVTSIGGSAFNGCTSLKSITIPDSVTSIGYLAFVGTAYYDTESNWENDVLYVGNHLIKAKSYLSGEYSIKEETKTIAKYAFEYCRSLTSIVIPDSVTSIAYGIFEGCTSLKSIAIPDSVTNINCTFDDTAYYKTESNWENGVLYIGKHLIAAKSSIIGEYSIKEETKTIADYAFRFCNNLQVVTIPNSVTSIGNDAFSDCTSLASITIPNSVTSIGEFAFSGCTSLESITIPNSVTSIGDYAFRGCTSLKSITIPDSVTSIGDDAFSGCTSLKSITIPDSVTSIGGSAFDGCTSLEGITIPNSVTSIGNYAFSDCTSLKSITIPDSVTSIGGFAFSGCTSLEGITIPNSVTSIGDYAFRGCTSLKSITIPDSVTSIGYRAFDYCTSMENIYVGSGNKNYCDIDGVWFNKDATELIQYPIGNTRTSYEILDSVTSIGGFAFSGCTSLEGITIPDSVTSIGGSAFDGCTSLEGITIPNSVTSIGNYTFSDCTSLKSITIPDSVTSIGGSAFDGCTSLKSITIPNSVTSIGQTAFIDCTSLKSISIPNSVTSIGWCALGYYAVYDDTGRTLFKIDGFTIYGYNGSYAETYANENSIPFVALKSIVQFDKSQIRFRGVGSDKDFTNYKDTFDVRTVAKISQEDFRNTFGTDEEALKNITDIGFIYAAEKNVTTFDLETAKKVAEGTGTDENYIKKSVSNIQHVGDGADYIFTCIVTDVPDADKEQKGYCFAYVCCNGTYYYFDDVTVMDFNALYTANKPQA